MRIYSIVATVISSALMAGASSVALAGSCGGGVCNSGFNAGLLPYEGVASATCSVRPNVGVVSAQNCNTGVVNHAMAADPLAPVNQYSTAPYGYLKTFEYKNTPNVNVMRVRNQAPLVALNEAPNGFTGGCNPVSTSYCRTGGTSAPMPQVRPMPRPVPVMRPAPRMVAMPAPVAPAQARIGWGYNPANFAPRQYGDNELTPGIAHIPTSIVDRSPITHIDGVPQQTVSSVTTVNGTYGAGFNGPRPGIQSRLGMQPRPGMMPRPNIGGNVLGHVSGGSYTYQTPGTPDYWEKTSGATVVDGLPATQIVCRRTGTAGASHTVNVVRPVIGVPQAVPTAIPMPARPVCAPAPRPMANMAPMPARPPMPQMPRPMPGSRWIY